MSQFASVFYSKNIDLKLNYNYNSNENTVFINEKNRLLVQEITLNRLKENEKNTFSFSVEGSGTALVQVKRFTTKLWKKNPLNAIFFNKT